MTRQDVSMCSSRWAQSAAQTMQAVAGSWRRRVSIDSATVGGKQAATHGACEQMCAEQMAVILIWREGEDDDGLARLSTLTDSRTSTSSYLPKHRGTEVDGNPGGLKLREYFLRCPIASKTMIT